MHQLRGDHHAAVAQGRDRALPVQRVRSLPQDERAEPTAGQAEEATCEFACFLTNSV